MPRSASHLDDHDGASFNAGIQETQGVWRSVWQENKGAFLILMSCITGSSMDAIARFLQQGEGGIPSFQIIFARMGVTFLMSTIYMWVTKVPDFPFGNPKVRGWLILRSTFGFMGLFCLYYSVHYLPLAEATVFRFLVPIITALECSVFLGESFTKKEFLAGLLAILGVVIIAHPASIFGRSAEQDLDASRADGADDVTSSQRLVAILVAFAGVFCASGAYTTIRVIGNRAHALMSVNYFAVISTIGSASALAILPGNGFTMPRDARQWLLLLVLGVLGFVLQFLLTTGLQLDRSSKATSMMYSSVIFALTFDFAIWGILPGKWSLIGGAIVVSSTLWSALQKHHKPNSVQAKIVSPDEETALLGAQREAVDDATVRRASISA